MNMLANYELLTKRVMGALEKSNLNKIKKILEKIEGPTLVSGVGGSRVVSNFLTKVLQIKNKIIGEDITFRDILYRDLSNYQNIIACSYGGTNYGVDLVEKIPLTKYLLSHHMREGFINLNYEVISEEHSFISLANTLIPMAIILYYYTNDINLIKEILNDQGLWSLRKLKEILIGYPKRSIKYLIEPTTRLDFINKYENLKRIFFYHNSSEVMEIMSGYETSTSATFLESTLVEAGVMIPVVHEKYNYCHGRSTLNYRNYHNLIIFDGKTELDNILREELEKYYDLIISFNKKYDDPLINDFYLTYECMLLVRYLTSKDLSEVDYAPVVRKLYKYKGEM